MTLYQLSLLLLIASPETPNTEQEISDLYDFDKKTLSVLKGLRLVETLDLSDKLCSFGVTHKGTKLIRKVMGVVQ